MSRIVNLPLALRQLCVKNQRITSINRNFSYSSRLSSTNLTSNQTEFHNRANSIITLGDNFHNKFVAPRIITGNWRNYSNQKPTNNSNGKPASSNNDDDPIFDDEEFEVYSSDEEDSMALFSKATKNVPSVNTVPDYFPRVPFFTTSYPIFPKFAKIFEITDPNLIKLIEWKLDLGQPYVGIFVAKKQVKDEQNKLDPNSLYEVKDLNDCYPIGAFVKITEVNKTDGKLQFAATCYRRIELEKQVKYERIVNPSTNKKSRKQLEEIQNILRDSNSNVLMVQVKNIDEVQPDLNSDEYKAFTMEIVKTIRDIIMSNTLIRENLQALLGNNLRVNDSPSYLADLAASITSSKPEEMQEIMEEKNILNRLKLALNLLMKEKQLLELQQKIGKDVETKIKEQHRVFLLREQLKSIKRELGLEKDDKDALAEKYKKLLEGKDVPIAVKTVLDEELNKLSFLDNNSSEFT